MHANLLAGHAGRLERVHLPPPGLDFAPHEVRHGRARSAGPTDCMHQVVMTSVCMALQGAPRMQALQRSQPAEGVQ